MRNNTVYREILSNFMECYNTLSPEEMENLAFDTLVTLDKLSFSLTEAEQNSLIAADPYVPVERVIPNDLFGMQKGIEDGVASLRHSGNVLYDAGVTRGAIGGGALGLGIGIGGAYLASRNKAKIDNYRKRVAQHISS